MRAVFAHDHIFLTDADGDASATADGAPTSPIAYTSGKLPHRVWSRYLAEFDALTVVGRARPLASAIPPGGTIDDARAAHDRSTGPRVDFVPLPNLSHPIALVTRRREAVARLREVIADAAVIARLPSEIGLLAVDVARAMNRPWAIEIAGCAWDATWHYGTWQGKVYAPIIAARTRLAARRASHALYVTRTFLQRRYPCPGHAVGCSDVDIGDPDPAALAARLARIESPPSAPAHADRPMIVGAIGSLSSRHKGVDTALRALARIRDRVPPFELRVLGAGDPAPWRAIASECGLAARTVFSGTLPSGPAVFSWLDDVDVYIQPSLTEGLPRALVEAMARACPALGSDAGGIPELLPAACLHRPGDDAALSSLLAVALTSSSWRAARARANFERARDYATSRLNARRAAFFRAFAQAAADSPR